MRGALLFICMVTGLCWHFSNFPWLCKVFSPTSLNYASQFLNLKAISKLGGDFAAISKLGGYFAEKWHFRRPFLKLGAFSQRGVDFVEEGNSRSPFRSLKVISQPYRRFKMRGTVLQNGTRVLKSGFAAAKHPSKWRLGCEIPAQLCTLVFKPP